MIEMRWRKTGLLAREGLRLHETRTRSNFGPRMSERDGLKRIFALEAPATFTKISFAKLLIFALLGMFTGLLLLLLNPFSVMLPSLTVAGLLTCISFLMFLTGLVAWKICS